MALLDTQQQFDLRTEWMDDVCRKKQQWWLSSDEVNQVIADADQWVVDQQASFNNNIPEAIRVKMTTEDKANLLLHVIRKRFLSGVN